MRTHHSRSSGDSWWVGAALGPLVPPYEEKLTGSEGFQPFAADRGAHPGIGAIASRVSRRHAAPAVALRLLPANCCDHSVVNTFAALNY
jgi:hypothetical protein